LKTAFKIVPEKTAGPQHLFIEIGYEGISFVIYATPFEVVGVLVFNFEKDLRLPQIAKEVQQIFSSEPQLSGSFESVRINYNFTESTLIPKTYLTENNTGPILSQLNGEMNGAEIFRDELETPDAYNIYRLDKTILNQFREIYPTANHFHATTTHLKTLTPEVTCLHCIVYHNRIKVILVKDNILQLVQHFMYSTPSDVAYHLLNTCNNHDIPVQETDCRLCGMIDEHSNLYNELYKYFLYLSFQKLNPEIAVPQDILQYPPHFFSQLILSAKCGS